VESDTITPLRRIAVFYDGTFFQKLSVYYRHVHARQKHVDLGGLHEYIRHKVASVETNNNVSLCQIVEAHFFRGRFSLNAAKSAGTLETDRLQDQLLMYADVVAHYYPMNEKATPPEERGIDVWLALEAYDLAVHKRFDVLVLIAGDQDYVPLVRKINGLGTRVMIIGVDLDYKDQHGGDRFLKTSRRLIEESPYTAMITEEVNSKTAKGDRIIDGIFR